MLTCAECKSKACLRWDHSAMPANCPMKQESLMERCRASYFTQDDGALYRATIDTACESKARGETRILEAIRLAKKMGWTNIGIAHCTGFRKEAAAAAKLIRAAGLQAQTVVCTVGGMNVCEFMEVEDRDMDDLEHRYSVGCNPAAQAELLNQAGTDYNLVLGLCVGHDAIFLKASHAPASVIMVKDRSKYRDARAGVFEALYDSEK